MEKGGVGLTGGNLIVVAGPIPDLGKLAISYSNGGANWVKGDLQAFLDDNIYGKFCRGNRLQPMGSQEHSASCWI